MSVACQSLGNNLVGISQDQVVLFLLFCSAFLLCPHFLRQIPTIIIYNNNNNNILIFSWKKKKIPSALLKSWINKHNFQALVLYSMLTSASFFLQCPFHNSESLVLLRNSNYKCQVPACLIFSLRLSLRFRFLSSFSPMLFLDHRLLVRDCWAFAFRKNQCGDQTLRAPFCLNRKY